MLAEPAATNKTFWPREIERARDFLKQVCSAEDRPRYYIRVSLALAIFLAVILKINHRLFSIPINEFSDFAANAIQIVRAKHFEELLGNYSRWGFHHPGPAFFYILALGEAVLHDWLRVTPAVMNAQVVTIVILNSLFLFIVLHMFAKHCQSKLFFPVAIALSIYFVFVVNHGIPGSALESIWMPYVLLFCFLLFAAAVASVAAGNIRHLPILVFAGLLLLHGHVAQPLFVFPLASLALVALLRTARSQMTLRTFLQINKKLILLSSAIVVVFTFPIMLDTALHKPNNLDAILVHTSAYHGLQNGWLLSLKYEASFFTFSPIPVLSQDAPASLLLASGTNGYVVAYWCVFLFVAGFTAATIAYRRSSVPRFFRYVLAEVVIILVLFFCWTQRISGPLYTFNGYFLYSVQLLLLLAIACLLLDGVARNVNWAVAVALSCAVPFLMLWAKPYFRSTETGWLETDRLVASLPSTMGPVHLTFPIEDWLDILGVESRLVHDAQPVCVTDDYWNLLGRQQTCDMPLTELQNLIFAHAPRECNSPCRTLERDERFVLQLSAYPWLKLPFQITGDGSTSINHNFYRQGNYMWSSTASTIRFLLAPDLDVGSRIGIRIIGEGLPGRPASVYLNEKYLGTMGAGHHTTDWFADLNSLRPGHENRLTVRVENAGPNGLDWRRVGYFIEKIEFGSPESQFSHNSKHRPLKSSNLAH